MRLSQLLFIFLITTLSATAQNFVPLELLANLNTGLSSGTDVPLVVAGDKGYFILNDPEEFYAPRLGVTDGTAAGTRFVYEWRDDKFLGPNGPVTMIPAGNKVYLPRRDELWVSDGTAEGTLMVTSGSIAEITRFTYVPQTGLMMFMLRNNNSVTPRLWRSDGTREGTFQIGGVRPYPFSTDGGVLGSYYYFPGSTDGTNVELWRSDGTSAQIVKDIIPGASSSGPQSFVASGGKLYFKAAASPSKFEIYATDGTANGTVRLTNFELIVFPNHLHSMVSFKGELFFVWNETLGTVKMYRSNGTPQGTTLFKDFGNTGVGNFNAAGDDLFFAYSTPAEGQELWATDGTVAGIRQVYDIIPGAASSNFGSAPVVTIGDDIFFFVYTNATTSDCWTSDGTTTTKIFSETGPGGMSNLSAFGDKLLFTHDDTQVSDNIWVATTAGARQRLMEFAASPGHTYMSESVPFNGFLYFTLNGKTMRTDAAGVTEQFLPWQAIMWNTQVINNKLHFMGDDGTHGMQLWSTDGTAIGTTMVTSFDPTTDGTLEPSFDMWDGKFLFTTTIPAVGHKFWIGDGSDAGTEAVMSGDDNLRFYGGLGAMNGRFYFQVYRNQKFIDLWSTDGTLGGTGLVKEIGEQWGPNSVGLGGALVFNNMLFFFMGTGPMQELWRSDGTPAGTIKLRRQEFTASLGNLMEYQGKLYFLGFSDQTASAIFETDGTEAGTKVAFDVFPGSTVDGQPLFYKVLNGNMIMWYRHTANFVEQSYELMSFDGTNFQSLGSFKPPPGPFQMFNNKLVFTAEGWASDKGHELWITDGTPAGTKLLRDTNPLSRGSSFYNYVVFSDAFYFKTINELGQQVWRSDGTTCGTQPMTSTDYIVRSIHPFNNQKFLVNALTADTGTEIFIYNRALEPVIPCRQQQYIHAADISLTYGDPNFNLSSQAESSAGLPLSVSLSKSNVININNGVVSIIGAGTVLMTLTQAGNNQFEPAQPVVVRVIVKKRNQMLQFAALPVKRYGDAPFQLNATSNSSNPIVFTADEPASVSISGNTVTILKADSLTITASQLADDNNHEAIPVERILMIGKALQTITFPSIPGKTFGDPDFTLNATSSIGLPIEYFSSDPDIISIDGNTASIKKSGTVTISALQAGNVNYEIALAVREVVVKKKSQVLTFAALPSKKYGDAPFNAEASATSGLPIVFTTTNKSVVAIDESKITILKPGTAVIKAVQSGNDDWEPATAERTLTVTKLTQSISSFAVADQSFDAARVDLSATTTSELPPTFVSNNAKAIIITGPRAEFVSAGKASITANQEGNDFFEPAPSITKEFCINPSKPTAALITTDPDVPAVRSNSSTGNKWFLNGAPLSKTTQQIDATAEGSYTVQVDIDGCLSPVSNAVIITITGLEDNSELQGYPNPVSSVFYLPSVREGRYVLSDMSGREAASGEVNSSGAIDVSHITTGLYMLSVQTSDGVYRWKIRKE